VTSTKPEESREDGQSGMKERKIEDRGTNEVPIIGRGTAIGGKTLKGE